MPICDTHSTDVTEFAFDRDASERVDVGTPRARG